jgi:hypothetical protein
MISDNAMIYQLFMDESLGMEVYNKLDFIQTMRKTPSLQGGDISTNLLFFDIFFDHFQWSTST